MTALVRAEWTKLLTTRVWLGLLLGSCVLVGGFATLFTAFAGSGNDRDYQNHCTMACTGASHNGKAPA